jgi:hypothetical protein
MKYFILLSDTDLHFLQNNDNVFFKPGEFQYYPISYNAEKCLIEAGLPFKSVENIISKNFMGQDLASVGITNSLIECMHKHFQYNGIGILDIYRYPINHYIGRILYYIEILDMVLKEPIEKIVIPNYTEEKCYTSWSQIQNDAYYHAVRIITVRHPNRVEYLRVVHEDSNYKLSPSNGNMWSVFASKMIIRLTRIQPKRRPKKNILVLDKYENVHDIISKSNSQYYFVLAKSTIKELIRWKNIRSAISQILKNKVSFVPEHKIAGKDSQLEIPNDVDIGQYKKNIINSLLTEKNIIKEYHKHDISVIYDIVIKYLIYNCYQDINYQINHSQAILREYNIDSIIFKIDSYGQHKIFASLANRMRIDTILIQHGVLSHSITGFGFMPLECKIILAHDRVSKRIYLNHNVNKKRIFLAGNQRLINSINAKSRNYEDKHMNGEKKIILIASTTHHDSEAFPGLIPSQWDLKSYFKDIKIIANTFPTYDYIIKFRSGDKGDYDFINDLTSNMPRNITFVFDKDIYRLINTAFMVISLTYYSTVVSESIAMNKLTVVYDKKNISSLYASALDENAISLVTNIEEFTDVMKKIGQSDHVSEVYRNIKDYNEWNEQTNMTENSYKYRTLFE